ncbi:MAG TPA: helix-turn-helix transcriptional regulator [Thermoanaerobaculia bacterium]|nr:helix-turn-helix transcriptional regulator [Thermoanaerobaculia bacterium]
METFGLIGETLRRLRRERDLTLEQVGEKAGLGRGQLSRIENSKQEATLSTLAKILACEGVSRREFFRRYDLVEAEALAVEREKDGGGTGAPRSPQDVLDLAGRLESFLQSTLDPSGTVAQGTIEVGDLVVMFRVLPRAATAPATPLPAPTSGAEKPAKPGRSAAGRQRKATSLK